MADIDLIYLAVNVVLTSIEKAREIGMVTVPAKVEESKFRVWHMPREDDEEEYPGFDRIM